MRGILEAIKPGEKCGVGRAVLGSLHDGGVRVEAKEVVLEVIEVGGGGLQEGEVAKEVIGVGAKPATQIVRNGDTNHPAPAATVEHAMGVSAGRHDACVAAHFAGWFEWCGGTEPSSPRREREIARPWRWKRRIFWSCSGERTKVSKTKCEFSFVRIG